MLRQSLRSLVVAAVATLTLGPSPGDAVTLVDACQTLDKFGETYRLTQDLSGCAGPGLSFVCLIVANDRITIDLQGHQIAGGCIFGISDDGIARDSITVKNGIVSLHLTGINLGTSSRTTVRNVTASDNVIGIAVGRQSLVKDCRVHGSSFIGLVGGDRVQVQGCDVSDNGFGITVGDECLITRNNASNNTLETDPTPPVPVGHGIAAGERCTVSHNVANENGNSGIIAGANSLVTSNEANNNGLIGITAQCPSTITHNTALGNDGLNFNPIGQGCVALHNNFDPT